MPAAERRRPAPRPPARDATGRSVACAPRPRSWAFEYRERSRCGIETTSSRRCSSGVEGTATPIESCLVGPGYCPSGPALSLGVSFRSRRVIGTDQLLGGPGSRPAAVDPLAARTLVKGEPLTPPAGRADDFAWPRREVGREQAKGETPSASVRSDANTASPAQ